MFEPMGAILTVPDGRFGRLPVDVGSTGFGLGQEFRFFFEFNIPNAESRWVRVIVPIDFTLKLQTFTVDNGALRFRSWRDSTDTGPWSAPASPESGYFNRNPVAATERGYVQQSTVELGGNLAAGTDGTVSEIVRLRTSGATAQQVTVGSTVTSERGVPAGTYYLQLENIAGSGASTGVYVFNLEERSGLTGAE